MNKCGGPVQQQAGQEAGEAESSDPGHFLFLLFFAISLCLTYGVTLVH